MYSLADSHMYKHNLLWCLHGVLYSYWPRFIAYCKL